MTLAADSPAWRAGWSAGLARGVVAFAAVAAIGLVLALAVWATGEGLSLGAAAGIGGLYVGAFHHVAIGIDVVDLGKAVRAGAGATSVSLGVAPLLGTAVAAWLLYRGGRSVADRVGGEPGARILGGAMVAPSYAAATSALALVVGVRTSLRLAALSTGELDLSASAWQALAFPLAIALAAGAAGGLRSALDAQGRERRALARVDAALAGGARMLGLSLALSIAGLFAAGVVQPDEPVALLTPSTARYVRTVFVPPLPGLVVLGHHVALGPNEAVWTLVPAMGGCDGVRGDAASEFLCYRRFPVAVGTTPHPLGGGETVGVPIGSASFGSASFGSAPPGYLLFLLVPLVSTVLGGRRAAERLRAAGAEAALAGAGAGLVFAALVAALALLSSVTIGFGSAFGAGESGWVIVGPNVGHAALLGSAWGAAGGAAGAIWAGRSGSIRSSSAGRARARGAAASPRSRGRRGGASSRRARIGRDRGGG